VDDGFILRVGRVKEIERYLAAADALLFPSYCEAFALVEIESAAMGLRLYVTPHYGSEMILRPPANGRFLPWDARGITTILAEDIDSGVLFQSSGDMGEALDRVGFLHALRERYQEILRCNGEGCDPADGNRP
jgi:glycosyltransferase involved in cell wall biosynthesis